MGAWQGWISWWRELRRPKSLGERGEDAAARFLRKLGYKILARRAAIGRGDIDIVALDGQTLVFVEVKTRTSPDAGGPEGAVDATKQRKLTKLALAYIKQHGLWDYPARFDVVALVWAPGDKRPTITHFPDAFAAADANGFYS